MKPHYRRRTEPKKKNIFERIGVMNLALLFVAVSLIVFTVVMVDLFKTYGTIPDTLCLSVFGVLGGECGALAWIKNTKEKNRDRKVELEDRKYYEEKERAGMSDGSPEDYAQ